MRRGPVPEWYKASELVGVAGFEPTTSSSRTIGGPKARASPRWSGRALVCDPVRQCAVTLLYFRAVQQPS
jgi:hypothetical protein